MTWLSTRLAALGDLFMSLSNRQRNGLVLVGLVLLATATGYKLVVSLNRLTTPMPSRLTAPVEQLFEDTERSLRANQQARQQHRHQLDSLENTHRTPSPLSQ
jgi:hypothetical protein